MVKPIECLTEIIKVNARTHTLFTMRSNVLKWNCTHVLNLSIIFFLFFSRKQAGGSHLRNHKPHKMMIQFSFSLISISLNALI